MILRGSTKPQFQGIKRKGGEVRRIHVKSKKTSKKRIPKSLLRKADDAFSLVIRKRDGRCMHPVGCPKSALKDLQCSHFIGRATKSTRFDPDNCIALCWFHHYKSKEFGLEYHKQTKEKHGFDGWYTKVMKQRLGPVRYLKLIKRSKQNLKLTREFLENLIKELQKYEL